MIDQDPAVDSITRRPISDAELPGLTEVLATGALRLAGQSRYDFARRDETNIGRRVNPDLTEEQVHQRSRALSAFLNAMYEAADERQPLTTNDLSYLYNAGLHLGLSRLVIEEAANTRAQWLEYCVNPVSPPASQDPGASHQ